MRASNFQTITDADIKNFAGISGDRNPVHVDENYATNSKKECRVLKKKTCSKYYSV